VEPTRNRRAINGNGSVSSSSGGGGYPRENTVLYSMMQKTDMELEETEPVPTKRRQGRPGNKRNLMELVAAEAANYDDDEDFMQSAEEESSSEEAFESVKVPHLLQTQVAAVVAKLGIANVPHVEDKQLEASRLVQIAAKVRERMQQKAKEKAGQQGDFEKHGKAWLQRALASIPPENEEDTNEDDDG